MEFNFVFLLIFLVILVQPVLAKRMLENRRIKKISEFENERGSRVIVLIHHQETMALLGFPVARYLDIQDSEEVLRAIKLTDPSVPIDLVIHTPGGLVLAVEQIAHALDKREGKVTVFVPHYAMSGGTMLALAADEIVMDENAVLGPIDPQVGDMPAASILSVLEHKNPDQVDDETMVYADIARKAMAQVKKLVRGILSDNMDPDKAEQLAEVLSSGQWTHDYPITVEEARELGLPVSTEMPEAVYDIMCLYKQSRQRRPSVAYIPMPYPSKARRNPPAE